MSDARISQNTISIQSIGAQGDGVGRTASGDPIYIPTALPEETWASSTGDDFSLQSEPSPDRIEASCEHYETCGGCNAQHMAAACYRDWKLGLITTALAREEIEAEIKPIWRAPPQSRRRASFEMIRDGATCTVGFHERQSHDVFDMRRCNVLSPAIIAALPALREIGRTILPNQGDARVSVTIVDNGLMISFVTKHKTTYAANVQGLVARAAKAIKAIQVMINGEIFVSREKPSLTLGSSTVTVPGATFLQAIPEAEQEMQRLVCSALKKSKSIADIFCGIGTFALPLAKRSRVTAFDNDQAATDALNEAARHTQGLKPVTAARRDLFRQPIGAREFKGQSGNGQAAKPMDGVVINPPRAGAKAQCEQLSKSAVRTIAMVSCNPTTFARDARILLDGGYTLTNVQPIDQFLWAPHLEVVAAFTRA